MTTVLWLSLLGSSAGFASGSYFLKRYADLGTLSDLGIAFSIFAVSNLIYAQVLSRGLGQGAALSSMTHLVLMSIIGFAAFNERLNVPQLGGLMLAICSIWLFSQSTQIAAAN